MTDITTAETPATPTNPEQVNPETVAPAVHPEVKDATLGELTSRLRTSLAAWPDTYQLEADEDYGNVVFALADGRRVGVELTIID